MVLTPHPRIIIISGTLLTLRLAYCMSRQSSVCDVGAR